MNDRTILLTYVALMTAVVVLSNVAVLYPLNGMLFGINLADLLTWGAFTYPLAFLVTDLTNRHYGPARARLVVAAGFVAGIAMSWYFSTPRIAIASGTAFLCGQLLDISVFNRLRRQSWWQAPLMGTIAGSLLDTALFFSIAFSASFGFLFSTDAFAVEPAPLLGVFAASAPRWISWALGDLSVKMLVGFLALLPYGALMNMLRPYQSAKA